MEQQDLTKPRGRGFYRPERLLLFIFVLTLPLLNPWVRGDGVGYYAFARAPLIQHNLDFTQDYLHANAAFRDARLDENGQLKAFLRTPTGHLDNHFTIGPAILWSPFLLIAHGGVLLARALGSSVAADGFSAPYRLAMAFATALYAFLGLLIAFRLARKYVNETAALIATIAVWWASSLPIYMYFNPSWSHAHSAFATALFLWYWHETRDHRTTRQWLLLGLIAGLMLDVYYANGTIFLVLLVEGIKQYRAAFGGAQPGFVELVRNHLLFGFVVVLCFVPTFVTRAIVYGSPFASGYIPLSHWNWTSPNLLAVLFSSNHGLIAWTPLILFSIAGLFLFWRKQTYVGGAFLAASVAFYFLISAYPDWAGISSYGNRFFVSLTPLYILGLAVLLDQFLRKANYRKTAVAAATAVVALFIAWNAGLMFQWGSHLIPARGPVSFSEVTKNQVAVVPGEIVSDLKKYLFKRNTLMKQIEQNDDAQRKKFIQQQQEQVPRGQ